MGVKITILDVGPDEEEEIIIKCRVLDEETRKLLNRFKQGRDKLKAYMSWRRRSQRKTLSEPVNPAF